jgi:hypothetical protein
MILSAVNNVVLRPVEIWSSLNLSSSTAGVYNIYKNAAATRNFDATRLTRNSFPAEVSQILDALEV